MKKKQPKSGGIRKPRNVTGAAPGESLDRWLARSIMGLGVLALFAPLASNESFFFPFVFLKSIIFRFAVEGMLLAYLVLAIRAPAYRPKVRLVSRALLAWFAVMLISSLPGVSVDPRSSWFGDFRRMGGMIAELHLLAYFFVLSQTLRRTRDWLVLFTAAIFSGVLMGFSGLIQYLRLDYLYGFEQTLRIEGAAGNADFFADAILLDFFLVLWFLGLKDKKNHYATMAAVWLSLLGAMDVFALCCDLFTGAGITSGLALLPVALFALSLHAVSLGWFFLRRRVMAGRIVLALTGAWFLFWMYHSQTRSALVGLIGGLFFLAGAYSWGSRSGKIRLASGLALLLLVLGPLTIYINRDSSWVKSNRTLARYTRLSLEDASNQVRIMAWRSSSSAVADRPLFGWGLDNFRNGFDRHFPVDIYTSLTAECWFDRAHNILVDVSTTTGLIGLAVYAGFFLTAAFFLLKRWIRERNATESILPLAFILAYLLQGFFSFDTINTDVILFLVLAYVAWLDQGGETITEEIAEKRSPAGTSRMGWVLAGIAVILLPAGWVYGIARPYRSNRLLQRARISSRVRVAPGAPVRLVFNGNVLNLYRQADEYGGTGSHDIHETFTNYAYRVAREASISPEEKLRAIEEAIRFLDESINGSPANARYYLYYSSLVNGTDKLVRARDPKLADARAEAALERLRKAELLCPDRPQLYLEQSQELGHLGRKEEEIAALEKLAALCPWFKDAHVSLAALYAMTGRDKEAAEMWRKIKERKFPLSRKDYNRVIDGYEAEGNYDAILALYKELLAKSPKDGLAWAGLAAAYRDSGHPDLAREAAMKAASFSPEARKDLKSFLDSLEK